MAEYGKIIDEFASINENIYQYFYEYFKDHLMSKEKNVDNKYSVYVSKLYCLLNKDCRYIIILTEIDDNPIKSKINLSNLVWISLQTRTLSSEEYDDLESHGYIPKNQGPLTNKIIRTEYNKDASTYKCEKFPIIITILGNKNKDAITYRNEGTIIEALETWQTIITFNEI